MTIKILPAITEFGAEAVYKAAAAALEGDYSKLNAMGIEATTLAHAWRAMNSAHKSMTPGEQAREQMEVNAELVKIERRGRPVLPPEDKAQVVSVRLTPGRRDKLKRLGSEWLNKAIDKAKLPE